MLLKRGRNYSAILRRVKDTLGALRHSARACMLESARVTRNFRPGDVGLHAALVANAVEHAGTSNGEKSTSTRKSSFDIKPWFLPNTSTSFAFGLRARSSPPTYSLRALQALCEHDIRETLTSNSPRARSLCPRTRRPSTPEYL